HPYRTDESLIAGLKLASSPVLKVGVDDLDHRRRFAVVLESQQAHGLGRDRLGRRVLCDHRLKEHVGTLNPPCRAYSVSQLNSLHSKDKELQHTNSSQE